MIENTIKLHACLYKIVCPPFSFIQNPLDINSQLRIFFKNNNFFLIIIKIFTVVDICFPIPWENWEGENKPIKNVNYSKHFKYGNFNWIHHCGIVGANHHNNNHHQPHQEGVLWLFVRFYHKIHVHSSLLPSFTLDDGLTAESPLHSSNSNEWRTISFITFCWHRWGRWEYFMWNESEREGAKKENKSVYYLLMVITTFL